MRIAGAQLDEAAGTSWGREGMVGGFCLSSLLAPHGLRSMMLSRTAENSTS